jgi:hypothetical protein
MRYFLAGLLTMLLIMCASDCLFGQNNTQSQTQYDTTKYITVQYGVIEENVRRQLDSAWSDKPAQVERAYCMGVVSYSVVWAYRDQKRLGREVFARVISIYPAKVSGATQYSLANVECENDDPYIHTHPPSTCRYDNVPESCSYGGDQAWQCQPSRVDYESLIRRKHKFHVIQCDRHAFRFYWPSEYRP